MKQFREFTFKPKQGNQEVTIYGPAPVMRIKQKGQHHYWIETFLVDEETFEAAKRHNMICYGILEEKDKADALPPWPPEDGTTYEFCDNYYTWNMTYFLWDHVDGKDDDPPSSDVVLTAAYFRGELEEV